MAKSRIGNGVIVRAPSGKSASYSDMRTPKGDRFRVLDKSVSDEANRRASKVIRDSISGRIPPKK